MTTEDHFSSLHISASIVDKQRTSLLYIRTVSPDSADLPLPFRRHFAEIRSYSGRHIHVSLDMSIRALVGPHDLLKMGVFIDVLVRVEFHLEEEAVSLDNMGEQTDGIRSHAAYPFLNLITDIWSDTPSHPCERVDQSGPVQLEKFDRLPGI